MCNNVNCTDDAHIFAISVPYADLIEIMSNASDKLVSWQGDKARPYKCRLGWNGHATDIHNVARECFVMWVDADKPKHGPVFDLMKSFRASFIYAIRFVKNHDSQLRNDSLAQKLLQSKPEDFWKEIRQHFSYIFPEVN